jgi:tetratricopeptide (TPR) repeat protein
LSAILIDVRNDVMRETNRRQVPWEHTAMTAPFYFKTALELVWPAIAPSAPKGGLRISRPATTPEERAKLFDAYRARQVAQERRDFDNALAYFSEAIKLDPQNSLLLSHRGYLHGEKKDFDRAIADLSEAIRLDPRDDVAFYNRGVVYLSTNNFDGAIADLTDAIMRNSLLASAYNNRGSAYSSKNDLDKAIANYTEAIRLNPNFAMAYYNRGVAKHKKGDDTGDADNRAATQLEPRIGVRR